MSLYFGNKPYSTPELSFLNFDLHSLLCLTKSRVLGNALNWQVRVFIEPRPTLAGIYISREERLGSIVLHPILNTSATPQAVIEHILIHELIHILIPSRKVKRKMTSHPEEFWELEKKLSLRRKETCNWMTIVLHEHLQHDKKKECIFVKKSWKNAHRSSFPTVEQINKFLQPRKCLAFC